LGGRRARAISRSGYVSPFYWPTAGSGDRNSSLYLPW